MRARVALFASVVCAVLAGCASGEFELAEAPPDDAALDVAAVDVAVLESAVVIDGCVANGCGGCVPLAPPPGTACGRCGTSLYVCSSETGTACRDPDDRTDRTYAVNNGAYRVVAVVAAGNAVAISFTMPRDGSITSVKLALARVDAVDLAAPGSLRVRLIRGSPSPAPFAGDVLADVSLPSASVSSSGAIVDVALPAALAMIRADEPVWLELTDRSDRSDFQISGTASSSEPAVFARTTSSYVRDTSSSAFLQVGIRACW